jgi:hypothetical protein
VWSADPESIGLDTPRQTLAVHVNDKLEPELVRRRVAERDHVAKLPGRIDVQQWERRLDRTKSFLRDVQHHARILADRIEQDRLAKLGHRFAHDGDRLGLEPLEVWGPSSAHEPFRAEIM